jgi:predicted Zn-dependent protease
VRAATWRRLPHLSLGATLVLSGACAISQQQEVQVGNDYAAQLARELPVVRDASSERYLTTLGNALAQATDTRGLTWHFTIVNSREVNAFAVPGGWIYINRGLIERAENLSQLAGVLAHEIGHVTQRHSVQQMQQAQGANAGVSLLCTLTKVCEGGAGQAAINVGGSALFAKFSRSDESEADAEAVRTTIRAGYDPRGIPGMFRILLAEQQRNPSVLEGFFLTHPLAADRVTATEGQIATVSATALRGLITDTPAFQAFRRRLLALPPAPAAKAPSR